MSEKKNPKPRSAVAVAMQRRYAKTTSTMKHRTEERGGARNTQQEFLSENEKDFSQIEYEVWDLFYHGLDSNTSEMVCVFFNKEEAEEYVAQNPERYYLVSKKME